MGYRGTRDQLAAKKAALLVELEAVDENLRLEARYLESRRRERWGALGGIWSRLATHAPKPVRFARDDGSVAALERDVEVLARALIPRWLELSERRGLVQRYDDEHAARIARSEAARTRSARQIGAGLLTRSVGGLMVIGQLVRVLFVPLLLLFAVLGAIGAEDGDGPDFPDLDGLGDAEPSTNPHDDRLADAVIGGGALLVLGAGGGALWWWLG